MKIQEYIRSGIVESYALGLASSEEVSQFERLLPFHPQLRDALSDFEFQLELFALENEMPPPSDIREKIEARLGEETVVKYSFLRNRKNRKEPLHDYLSVKVSSPYMSVHKSWRPIFLMVFLLSKIFLGLFIYYLIKYEHASRDILQLQQQLVKPAPSTTDSGD